MWSDVVYLTQRYDGRYERDDDREWVEFYRGEFGIVLGYRRLPGQDLWVFHVLVPGGTGWIREDELSPV